MKKGFKKRKFKKEDGVMQSATILTPSEKTKLLFRRKSLEEIKEMAKQRRKTHSCNDYVPKEENEFFETMESSIYKQIVSDEDEF